MRDKIELMKQITELAFVQSYKNINLSFKVKNNFEKLLKDNPELDDFKCKVKKCFNEDGITICNTYYPNSLPMKQQIDRYKKFKNYYHYIKFLNDIRYILYLLVFPPFILFFSINAFNLLMLCIILLMYPLLYYINKYSSKKFIYKDFYDTYIFKYKLNITKEEYKLLTKNLFNDCFDHYSKRIYNLINVIAELNLYCEYETKKGKKKSIKYDDNVNKDIILEIIIYEHNNLKLKDYYISIIEALLDIYNLNIKPIKCKI